MPVHILVIISTPLMMEMCLDTTEIFAMQYFYKSIYGNFINLGIDFLHTMVI